MCDHPILQTLSTQQLRELLHKFSNAPVSTRPLLQDSARFLSAYFLGFPLFLPKANEHLPSLFVWAEIKPSDVSSSTSVERSYVCSLISSQLSAKLPCLLLVHLGLSLEAILYSDYFNDQRAALILRIYADSLFGFSLVSAHCFHLLHESVPSVVDRLSQSAPTPSDIQKTCQNIVSSILELDIVLNGGRIFSLEAASVSKMELIFAGLDLQVSKPETLRLPRPQIYEVLLTEDKSHPDYGQLLKCHIFCSLFITSLHETNRLSCELDRLRAILAKYDTQFTPPTLSSRGSLRAATHSSLLLRVLLVTLRLIYRDIFSASLVNNEGEVSNAAAKYKALLVAEEEESDIRAIERWLTLALDSDLECIRQFVLHIQHKLSPTNNLPSFCAASREVWYERLVHGKRLDRRRSEDECSWLHGVTTLNKIDTIHYQEMDFLSSDWTAPQLLDPSLISMSLHIRPEEICIPDVDEDQKPSYKEVPMLKDTPTSSRYSTRIVEEHHAMLGDIRPRRDLITEYARRGEKLLGLKRGTTSERSQGHSASRRELVKKTLDDLRWMKGTQRELVEGAERERNYVDSLGTESPREASSLAEISPSVDKVERLYEGREEIRARKERVKDWGRERRHEVVHVREGRQQRDYAIGRVSPEDEPLFSPRDLSSRSDNTPHPSTSNTSIDLDQLEDLEQDEFHDVDIDNVSKELPQIERLDLSSLSPPPTVGRRESKAPATTKSSPKIQYIAVPEWLKLLPLDGTSSLRAPLLHHPLNKKPFRKAFTERASQTCPSLTSTTFPTVSKDQSLISPADSGFHSRHTIGKVLLVNQLSPNAARNVLDSME